MAAGLAVSGLTVGSGTNAAFTASASSGASSWSTGTVTLSNDAGGSALFTATATAPGGGSARCVTVTYSGSVAAGIRLYATALSGALAPYVDVTIAVGTGDTTGGSCAAFTRTQELFNGTLSALAAGHGDFAAGLGGFAPSAGPASAAYRISWQIDNAAPNSVQNTTASSTFTWEAQNSATSSAPPSSYLSLLRADGATGIWRLDEPTGTSATEQVSGANGTYSATGLTRGVPGPGTSPGAATTFDGATGAVSVPGPTAASYQFSDTAPFTVEAWVRPGALTHWATIVQKTDYTSANVRQGWQLWVTSDNNPYGTPTAIGFQRWGGAATNYNLDSAYSPSLSPDVWHHIAGTYDGSNMRVYVDGQLQGTSTSGRSISPTTAPLEIAQNVNESVWFPGGIADVAVYPVALTQAQLQTHYTAR
jgi:hypothetical protein